LATVTDHRPSLPGLGTTADSRSVLRHSRRKRCSTIPFTRPTPTEKPQTRRGRSRASQSVFTLTSSFFTAMPPRLAPGWGARTRPAAPAS